MTNYANFNSDLKGFGHLGDVPAGWKIILSVFYRNNVFGGLSRIGRAQERIYCGLL